MKQRICIVSFSPIHRDARVLRQIEYLAPHFDLTVIGYGPRPPAPPDVDWAPVATRSSPWTRLLGLALLVVGRLWTGFYDVWYWQKPHHRQALAQATRSRSAAYHANDWNALPIAAEAARSGSARVVLDAHEYAPLEFEDRRSWRWFYKPMVTYFLRKYAPSLSAATTVAAPIAERYRAEFGFAPLVVLNAPKLVPLPPRIPDPAHIHLVYHGGATPDRHLEAMIEAIAQADGRFRLHFILVDHSSPYVQTLKALTRRVAPDRVLFHDPVPPAEIVARIAQYDIGFYLLKPSSFNNSVALPNKFFDFLAAGLAVCIGPSLAMAELVQEYGFGRVAPSFAPEDAARLLNGLTHAQVAAMQQAARAAAARFNADTEMGKLIGLYRRLLDAQTRPR